MRSLGAYKRLEDLGGLTQPIFLRYRHLESPPLGELYKNGETPRADSYAPLSLLRPSLTQ
ncbi:MULTISPECIES: hypothetical protein [Pyrobaculum]|uniref:Uncharacterized protein n=1 Tax=Pyrobaculum arsenaticum TaxID=121277 RepID=A0A7L4PA53_9CREN|nr:hypothetical protein [Pyrobaculum arsenaticum]MCY0891268.1 hypothetical protein [Pyrobaculum arsenaticum]NYR15553.1 hypothetical protein [Pyrobaculum arsenaticum]